MIEILNQLTFVTVVIELERGSKGNLDIELNKLRNTSLLHPGSYSFTLQGTRALCLAKRINTPLYPTPVPDCQVGSGRKAPSQYKSKWTGGVAETEICQFSLRTEGIDWEVGPSKRSKS